MPQTNCKSAVRRRLLPATLLVGLLLSCMGAFVGNARSCVGTVRRAFLSQLPTSRRKAPDLEDAATVAEPAIVTVRRVARPTCAESDLPRSSLALARIAYGVEPGGCDEIGYPVKTGYAKVRAFGIGLIEVRLFAQSES